MRGDFDLIFFFKILFLFVEILSLPLHPLWMRDQESGIKSGVIKRDNLT
jgi:hypothetical protein